MRICWMWWLLGGYWCPWCWDCWGLFPELWGWSGKPEQMRERENQRWTGSPERDRWVTTRGQTEAFASTHESLIVFSHLLKSKQQRCLEKKKWWSSWPRGLGEEARAPQPAAEERPAPLGPAEATLEWCMPAKHTQHGRGVGGAPDLQAGSTVLNWPCLGWKHLSTSPSKRLFEASGS